MLLQPSSTRSWLKPNPSANELAVVITQLATTHPDWEKDFPAGSGHHAGQEDCFLNSFIHRRTAVAHSEPTKALLKQNPETAILSVTPPIPPFCLSRTYLQRSLQEHKMKVSCRIYLATSRKGLMFYYLFESGSLISFALLLSIMQLWFVNSLTTGSTDFHIIFGWCVKKGSCRSGKLLTLPFMCSHSSIVSHCMYNIKSSVGAQRMWGLPDFE